MKEKIVTIIKALFIILFIGFNVFVIYQVAQSTKNIEVQTYTVGAEISHLDKVEERAGFASSKTVYSMSIRNDDFATEFELTAEQYASYVVNDIVEVEVTEWETYGGKQVFTYELVK
jgi:hypothetical protein